MPPDGKLRAFVAIDVSPEIRDALAAARGELADLPWAGDVRWVRAENQHLTLRFLGDVERSFCVELVRELERRVAEVPVFDLSLVGLVAFPSARRPRVIAAGVEDDAPVTQLARAVEAAVVAAGGEAEERRFRPHITLGRFRKPPRGKIDLAGREVAPVTMSVCEAVLLRSELDPNGAKYSTLGRVALGTGVD